MRSCSQIDTLERLTRILRTMYPFYQSIVFIPVSTITLVSWPYIYMLWWFKIFFSWDSNKKHCCGRRNKI